MKRNGRSFWTEEELKCSCKHPNFTKTERVIPPNKPGADTRHFYRTVCKNCLTAFKKIPGNEGKVDQPLTYFLKSQAAKKKTMPMRKGWPENEVN